MATEALPTPASITGGRLRVDLPPSHDFRCRYNTGSLFLSLYSVAMSAMSFLPGNETGRGV
ncbi:hypothetical protein CGRA01v4_09228 [Colletotrichum graminicola]|uniref:Uncharacterized protein n=1 Tax=Colletotrichum graminicola (strain M1.001 / M2 / FGSC 10212) TaxID=645133 RepID=E3Q6U1_COLGM|nr:uncharacterized protein GLRG_02399 [Colletotrichum graminicola M1.001]EFQ26579.1 hypothetical protein GLRG_02399 [Colletotrichum graminicola M1.001]WDK17942.1 hypothetical protein CGRA01v4_09228 [Colletotrichum graminicola]